MKTPCFLYSTYSFVSARIYFDSGSPQRVLLFSVACLSDSINLSLQRTDTNRFRTEYMLYQYYNAIVDTSQLYHTAIMYLFIHFPVTVQQVI